MLAVQRTTESEPIVQRSTGNGTADERASGIRLTLDPVLWRIPESTMGERRDRACWGGETDVPLNRSAARAAVPK
ncbi:hypothetical protein trd_1903 [Thermomicrobium roseum DSM 5159]|uniref:Uncharacterized protein n=1 Tax=Thermomicrobium roseum (strain ATCC 27502 / DSM 5159 / P-2) TaxID=309801 RepID=B9L203_THERP|nr:hypothetical protein trd_1903 [Thermomicrobium roseum DSM 5159]